MLSVGFLLNLSTALWTNCAVIDLSCVSAVHPLAAAVAERGVLLDAGVAQHICTEKNALRARFAFSAAGAYKTVLRHWFSSFFVVYRYNISTKKDMLRMLYLESV